MQLFVPCVTLYLNPPFAGVVSASVFRPLSESPPAASSWAMKKQIYGIVKGLHDLHKGRGIVVNKKCWEVTGQCTVVTSIPPPPMQCTPALKSLDFFY